MPAVAIVLVVFVLLLVSFVVMRWAMKQDEKPKTIPKNYSLKISEQGFPYYAPDDQESDIRIPYDQFVKAFPSEHKKV